MYMHTHIHSVQYRHHVLSIDNHALVTVELCGMRACMLNDRKKY